MPVALPRCWPGMAVPTGANGWDGACRRTVRRRATVTCPRESGSRAERVPRRHVTPAPGYVQDVLCADGERTEGVGAGAHATFHPACTIVARRAARLAAGDRTVPDGRSKSGCPQHERRGDVTHLRFATASG